jgi:hypothetical protein
MGFDWVRLGSMELGSMEFGSMEFGLMGLGRQRVLGLERIEIRGCDESPNRRTRHLQGLQETGIEKRATSGCRWIDPGSPLS